MGVSLQKLLITLAASLTALLGHNQVILTHQTGHLTAEVAQTAPQQAQGLSGRKSLGTDQGLLFVFEKDGKPGFWMKDMNFPLDIIWLKADQSIAEVSANVATSTFPTIFVPKTAVRYVLEVNAGYAAKHDLKAGDFIHFSLKQ